MRVTSFCRVLWNGGVQRVAIQQVEALRALGYDVALIFGRATPGTEYNLPDGTLTLSGQSDLPSRKWHWLLDAVTKVYGGHRGPDATVDVDLILHARRLLLSSDCVIFNDQYAAFAGVWNRMFHGKPYVLMFHEFFPRVSKKLSHRLLFPFADVIDVASVLLAPSIVTTSSRNYTRLRRMVGNRVLLARLACPTPSAQTRELAEARRRVLSVAVWDRGRHPEILLEIAKALPSFSFVIAGSWTDAGFQEEIATQAKNMQNVTVTGRIHETDLEELYRSCLLFVRLGFREAGPGMGGLEALSHGCLVITNRDLGIAEILTHGKNGFVCELPNSSAIIRTLEQIESLSDDQIQALSEAASQLAASYTWTRHATVLVEAMRTACTRLGRRPTAA